MCSAGGLPSAIYSDRDSYRFSFYRRKQMRFTASLQQANLRRTERELQRSHSFLCRPMKTLQGRLPYIFRYLGINTIDKANAFLKEFIIHFNTRFSVKAQEETVNWHSPPHNHDFDYLFSVRAEKQTSADGSLNLLENFSFGTGYLEMRCSKSCYLRDLELVNLFENEVSE